jgi:hypothetical protein
MPIISTFFGILIRINFKDHNPPHFHAEYQGFKAVFEIKSAKILAGEIPKQAQTIIKSWTIKHKTELLKNWNLAQSGQPVERISGEE